MGPDLFDHLALMEERTGAPAHFHQDESWSPEDLISTNERERLRDRIEGPRERTYRWGISPCHDPRPTDTSGHAFTIFSADFRCCPSHKPLGESKKCLCVGSLLYRGYCFECEWWGPIVTDENAASASLMDHCWPGWRELPVLSKKVGFGAFPTKDLPADYPVEWMVPGAPIITYRKPYGTRNVPAYSPWGGLDIAADESGRILS